MLSTTKQGKPALHHSPVSVRQQVRPVMAANGCTRDAVGGKMGPGHRGAHFCCLSQAKEAETVPTDSYLNGAARSQAAEVHTTESANLSEKSLFSFAHTYPESL